MTLELFIIFFTIGVGASSILTEALKTAFECAENKVSLNVLALVSAVIIGGVGTLTGYLYLGITLNLENIMSVVCMIVCMWVSSMVGYDKVIQLLNQINNLKKGGM